MRIHLIIRRRIAGSGRRPSSGDGEPDRRRRPSLKRLRAASWKSAPGGVGPGPARSLEFEWKICKLLKVEVNVCCNCKVKVFPFTDTHSFHESIY
jgi:hypothetical protein